MVGIMSYKYTMSLSLNVLNHLGINLYSNIPSVISEIVANSWDADAKNVDINIDNNEITISDDGCGMTCDDINDHFLRVGYQKRTEMKASPTFSRPFMGRKGIGKLSMFSIAKEVDVISQRTVGNDTVISALRMDVDKIAASINNENSNAEKDYHPEELKVNDEELKQDGTRIILRHLKKNTSALTPEYLRKRIARRFGIIGEKYNFAVKVNGKEVTIQDRDYFHKLRYIWYYGNESSEYADYSEKASYKEERGNTIKIGSDSYTVTGWIGTVDGSGDLKDGEENINKIVILVRGKLGQEDILSDYSEGGLYTKYLIGEINADFFDDDSWDDMATSSRQEFKRDDERFLALKKFLLGELKYIQGKWTNLRNESGLDEAKKMIPEIDEWIKSLTPDDKSFAKKMFGKINQMPVDNSKKTEVIKYSILAFEKLRYSNKLNKIETIDIGSFELMKDVFLGIDEFEATLYYQIIKERVEIIRKFQQITDDDMREKVIQEYLFNHLWLLDPSWERVDGTEYMEKTVLNALNREFDKLTEEEKRARLDIGYRTVAGKHIVIELKKVGRVVSLPELVGQVSKYDNALKKVLSDAGHGREPYEIVCILGKDVDNDSSAENKEKVTKVLEPMNARVICYSELIENAFKSYNEFIRVNNESQKMLALMNKLEIEEIND